MYLPALAPSLVAVSTGGFQWGWVLAAGIGVLTGLAAHRSREEAASASQMGCLSTVAVGVLGAVAGELLLGRLFDVGINDVLGVMLCAFIGASGLVILFSNRPRRTRSEPRNEN